MVNLLASSHEGKLLSFTVVSRWWQQFQNLNWYLTNFENSKLQRILSLSSQFTF